MDKIAEKQARERADELEMQSWATSTEAKAILLMVGESVTVKCPSLQAYQRLRTRLYRIKDTFGKNFTTSLIKNDVMITRIEDEPVKNPTAKWISQRKAFQMYGEANVRRLFGKIATNQRGNRIELYLPDIEKHLQPKKAVEK